MSARIVKSTKKPARRIHTHVPADWLKTIDKAAAYQGITRANFMATASHAAAEQVLKKATAEKARK